MPGPTASASIGRLWRTLRWLRAEQWLGRARLHLARPRPERGPPPPLRAPAGAWVPPPAREASLVGPARLRLLGVEHDLADVGWDEPALPLLWRYNQHYFDDLNAAGAADRRAWQRAWIQRWCDECPPARGTAWAPYPTSLRIVNWAKFALAGEVLEPAWIHSLAIQARWLMRRLEWHLLGNHLFANAKALLFAGLLFDGDEARRWEVRAVALLQRELPEQFLADGAQFELSPMYHLLALEDLLDLLNLLQARASPASPSSALAPELRRRCGAMLHWLRCLRHPDGTLARFNDAAEGIAPPTDDVERYAAALGVTGDAPPAEGVTVLRPSGYVRMARGDAVALLDIARVGPDYVPGHAHADTLSFELSVRGLPLIVNRGTSVYGDGPRRQVERGTASHSTLQIGEHDSSEVWAGFRVGRRARPGPIEHDGWIVAGTHDGYAHLPVAPRHRRRWQLDADGLDIEDRVEPSPAEPARARFHLAPGLDLVAGDDRWNVIDAGGQVVATARVRAGTAASETGLQAVRFGSLVEAATLVVTADDQGRAAVRWSW